MKPIGTLPQKGDEGGRAGAAIPANRAFVCQLASAADPGRGILVGRVEHVTSGRAAHFRSVEDLISFMGRVLSPERR
jgi:hypothetical protein